MIYNLTLQYISDKQLCKSLQRHFPLFNPDFDLWVKKHKQNLIQEFDKRAEIIVMMESLAHPNATFVVSFATGIQYHATY